MVYYTSSAKAAPLQIRTDNVATTEVIDHGTIDLKEMYDSFPSELMYEEQDPASVIAALLWLDTRYSTHQEDDKVILHPALLYFLMPVVKVIDNDRLAQLAKQVSQELLHGEEGLVDEEEVTQLATRWFTVSFLNSVEGQALLLHPILKGRKIAVRILTGDEIEQLEAADALFWAATVRADGSPIPIPVPPPSAGMKLP